MRLARQSARLVGDPVVNPMGCRAGDQCNVVIQVGGSEEKTTARLEHAADFREKFLRPLHMLQYIVAECQIEFRVPDREPVMLDQGHLVEFRIVEDARINVDTDRQPGLPLDSPHGFTSGRPRADVEHARGRRHVLAKPRIELQGSVVFVAGIEPAQ